MIKEWPSEISSSGPVLQSPVGTFSFSPGVKLLGSLLASAASATTVDGGIRKHPKIDNSRYTYNGRSYGAGASVGLTDQSIAHNPLALSYVFQENGLGADVVCIYNSSAEFIIADETDPNIYPVQGYLRNSGDSEEYSEYYGHSSDAIVAIGVAKNNASTKRILGIAAGKSYAALNTTQCTVSFIPKVFNVSVSLSDRSINVTETADGVDFAARENLTYSLIRQFELMANDQTNLYVSVIGDSLNSSIASYNSSVAFTASLAPDEASATLAGLTNSVTAMVDDLLVAYASAQLMIMNDSSNAPAIVNVQAFRYGSGLYIYLTFAINTVIVLLFVEETVRTRGWKDLPYFDYADPRSLIIGASMGGSAVARAVRNAWTDRTRPMYKYNSTGIGNVRVTLHENCTSLVLNTWRSYQKKLPEIPSHND